MAQHYSLETLSAVSTAEASTLDERLEQSRQVLVGWSQKPPAGDMYIAHYATAMLAHHDVPGPIADTMRDLLQHRPEMGASHLETFKLRAMQKQLIRLYGQQYPTRFPTVQAWSQGIQEVLESEEALDEWLYDMQHRELQTNDPNRADNLKVFLSVAHALGRVASDSILEVGASQGLIQKRLAKHAVLGWQGPMPHFGVTHEEVPLPHVVSNGGIHLPATQAYHNYLHRAIPLGVQVCMDRQDPLESREWTLLSLYPGEHEDQARLEYMRDLAYSDFENVRFHIGDFDALDVDEYHRQFPRANTVFASTCFYQSPPDARVRMTEKAISMAEEFVFLQDNCVLDMRDPTKLVYPSDWQTVPYGYRSYIWDKRARDPKWEEFSMSPNSRAHVLRMGGAEIVSDRVQDRGRSVRVIDVLLGAAD